MLENKIKGRTKKTRRQDKQNFYLTSEQIYNEWLIWKETGTITEQFGKYLLEMARGVCGKPSFRNFSEDMKEELTGNACLAIIKNLKNMKPEYKDAFFNYLTRTIYCSFYATLNKYYKHVNGQRKILLNALDQAFMLNPSPENAVVIKELEKSIKQYERHNASEHA